MINKISYILIIFMIFLVVPGSVYSQGDDEIALIIVNNNSTLSDISLKNLKRIYLGRISAIKGSKIIPIAPREDPVYDLFRKVALKVTPKIEKAYWLKEQFKGTVSNVKNAKTEKEVVDFVSNEPKSIGVISSQYYDDVSISGNVTFKVITVEGTPHNDTFYKLKY